MRPVIAIQTYSRQEWTRRFAYRAMLLRPYLDSVSAVMVAEDAFDGAHTRDPEAAAESLSTFVQMGTGKDLSSGRRQSAALPET